MRCPFCGSEDTKVVDSRSYLEGNSIKRRRECVICQRRFSTFERVEEVPLYVIKRIKEEFPSTEKSYERLDFCNCQTKYWKRRFRKIVYEVEKIFKIP